MNNYDNNRTARVLSINKDGLHLSVLEREYFITHEWAPFFIDAKVCDVFDVKLLGRSGIRWEKLDVDLEIESLDHPERYPHTVKDPSVTQSPYGL